MEFLKEVFQDEALTYEQLSEKLASNENIKLANLASGEYVGAEKFKAQQAKVDALTEQLEAANKAVEEFKGMDIEGVKAAADKYKQDAEAAQKAADERVEAANYKILAIEAAGKHNFTSNSAKNAFIAALTEKQLQVADGKLVGLEEFNKTYQESDPDAFKTINDTPPPTFTKSTTPPQTTGSWRDKISANFTQAKKGE